jgi:lipid-binding SYLF domain-containing protein
MNAKVTCGLAMIAMVFAGCATPMGDTASEQKANVQKMRAETLAELYKEKPITRQTIAKAAGCAVFSNINVNLLVLSSGNGYGVARNTRTGKDIYMKMRSLGVGFGAGVKDFRAVLIFKTDESLKKFTTEGWEWGAHADAAAKSGEKGKAVGTTGDITGDIEIYTFTESGIALQATIAGTKYWKDELLN